MDVDFVANGSYLRDLRNQKGISLFKAANSMNISGNYLSMIERGKRCPSDAVLHSIARFYKIDESKLFLSYGKITKESIKAVMEQPALQKLMTKISLDKHIQDDIKEEVATEMLGVYNNYFGKGDE